MLAPCEVTIKCVLPSIRAMIAKELIAKYNLKQTEAAKILGLSQPAISLYNRKMRGKAIDIENDKDVRILIENLTESLAKGNLAHKDFIPMFCEVCRTIRTKGLMCELHKAFEPTVDLEGCELCKTVATKCIGLGSI
ncbi:transcriptional regulator [Candidatus Bathyarchaeota archaeon]|nr:transcriptional regulator [Candidatus Bathyarchaeota archaeon]